MRWGCNSGNIGDISTIIISTISTITIVMEFMRMCGVLYYEAVVSHCALRSGDGGPPSGGVRCRSGVGASGGWCLDKVVRAVLLCSASDLLPRTTSNGAHCYVMLKRGQRVRRGRLTGNKLLATLCLLAARVQLTTMVM